MFTDALDHLAAEVAAQTFRYIAIISGAGFPIPIFRKLARSRPVVIASSRTTVNRFLRLHENARELGLSSISSDSAAKPRSDSIHRDD
ncbi:MAG: hypothetical protein HY242_07520 [Afipia sp.]|nr:hypothetical protein [Afipia sp.]